MEKEEFLRYVAGLVAGDMVVILNSLPAGPETNSDTFKEAVLKKYRMGPDHFRKKLHDAAPKKGKSMAEFMAQLWESFHK